MTNPDDAPPTDGQREVATPPDATPDVPPEQAANRPCKSFSVSAGSGVNIEASIWPREITIDKRVVTVYSVTTRKSYKTDADEYRSTNFFRGSEVPLVQYVLGCASQWILDQQCEENPPF